MKLRNLSVGTSGPDVKAVQDALNTWGADPALNPDGQFGRHTLEAVQDFQRKHGLKDDGVVGRKTRVALFPVGVATVTIYGMRLRLPDFSSLRPKPGRPTLLPGTLKLNPTLGWNAQIRRALGSSFFRPLRLPRLGVPIAAPAVPEWNFTISPLPGQPPARPLGFAYDHIEVQPGAQSTFQFAGGRQDAFVLTMQNVYLRGPDDGSHQEADLGVQIGTPFSNPNGPWTVNPFVQLTDVDRFGSLGLFHYWQPYAQVGFQFSGLGRPQPALTGNLFPVNLGLDIGDNLTVNFAGGLAFTLDLQSGAVQAGLQLSAGLSLKMGRPGGFL